MKDAELKRILEKYSDDMLEAYDKRYTSLPEHTFSPEFEKKMKRLVRNQKWFGSHAVTGGRIARAASVLLACGISLAGAAHISAEYFGINPWKEFAVSQGEMDQVQYEKKEGEEGKSAVREHMIPTYVPEGFKETSKEISLDMLKIYNLVWKTEDKSRVIIFNSIEISGDSVELRDNEFVSIEKASIATYEAKFCYKEENDNIILLWNDDVFENMIIYTGVEKDEIIQMAESLYGTEEKK